jgi:hypothetical protein
MATTVNGLPVPDDTDPVAQGAANMRAMAGKLQVIASGTVTIAFSNAPAANQAITFPVGRFSTGPWVTAISRSASNYFAYSTGIATSTGTTLGARQYKDALLTGNVLVDWVAVGT